jgi:cytochrome c-type biogenesis protein CcmH/NrfF
MAVSSEEAPHPVGVEENWLVRNIMCQCGTCRHNLLECESDGCAHAVQDRIEIHRLLNQGKNREQVIQYFISKYGSQIALAAPIDKGFNRLAWLLPYTAGVAGAGLLGFGAWRLSRRSGGGGTSAKPDDRPLPVSDPKTADQLSDKLDDELRNLD